MIHVCIRIQQENVSQRHGCPARHIFVETAKCTKFNEDPT